MSSLLRGWNEQADIAAKEACVMNTPNVDLEISLEQCESKQKVVTPNVINSIYMIWYIDTKLV